MKCLKSILIWLILVAGFNTACTDKNSSDEQTDKIFQSLKDNQARILIKIDGKEFYPSESVFSGQALMSGQVCNLTLTDQFDGKTILNIGKDKWFATTPVGDKVDAGNPAGTSLKMGKIINREKMIGEGYMMADGEIEAQEFSKEKIVFKLTGKVGKYSDFQQPDKLVAFDGIIVYKKPALSLANITEKEVFSASTTNK